MSLYRIWIYNSNDRRETARIKATDFDVVQQFLLSDFIKPEHREEVELTEYGLEWLDGDPEECKQHQDLDSEDRDDPDYNPCEYCDGCNAGFQIEEVEDPDPEDYSFLTIFGTNDYYDLTQPQPEKAEDWDEGLYEAWKRDPQIGVATLILATIRDNPELEKGFSPDLIERSKQQVEA